jgi:membrane carboxypeptidase/penicillin-binding protein
VGYTPSVSVAAWVGGDGNKPLHGKNNSPIYGSTIAGPMWQKFLSLYLTGKPGERFDKVERIGGEVPPPSTDVATTTESTPTDENTDNGDNGDQGGDNGHGHGQSSSQESTSKHTKGSTPNETPTDTSDPGT